MYGITDILYLVLHFFLPVILVLFLYGHMFIRLKSSGKSGNESASSSRNVVLEKAKTNVFKTMLLITICYSFCYVFNSVYVTLISRGILETISGKYLIFISCLFFDVSLVSVNFTACITVCGQKYAT